MKGYQLLIALLVLIFVVVGLAAVTQHLPDPAQDQANRASGILLDVLKNIAVTLTRKMQNGEGLFQ